MKTETFLLFALLRNALFQEPLKVDEWRNVDWNLLYALVKSHTLQTLVAEAVLSLPDDCCVPLGIRGELTRLMGRNMAEHMRLNADIAKVFHLLVGKGFHPVLMKGQGNAAFYPKTLLRKCGDVDIYVGETDYDAACRFLLENLDNAVLKGESEKHRVIFWGKTDLEIHRIAEAPIPPQNALVYADLVNKYFSQPDYVVIAGQKIAVPPAQFNAVYVFYHLYRHFKLRGISLRQFCDVAVLLHQFAGRIDLRQLKEDLAEFRLMEGWQLFGSVFVRYLGLPQSEFPFYREISEKKSERLARLVVDDGDFAKNVGRYYKGTSFWGQKFYSFCGLNSRYWRIARISPSMALTTYPYIVKCGIKAAFR